MGDLHNFVLTKTKPNSISVQHTEHTWHIIGQIFRARAGINMHEGHTKSACGIY